MADVTVRRAHRHSIDEVKQRFAAVEQKLKERFGVVLAWSGANAEIKGRGVSGSVTISGTDVAIDLKLGLLVRPFAGRIREGLERELEESIA